jgi:hypothetical protein
MYTAFFALAAVSPTRQQAFRWTMIVHLGLILMVCWLIAVPDPSPSVPYLGQVLLVAGIVEGAILIGWRLTQMPKSLGLEFLLACVHRRGVGGTEPVGTDHLVGAADPGVARGRGRD